MALRNIVTEGDEILSKKARVVTEIDHRIITLIDDMIETMRASEGVGLAAPQVGVLRRVFVLEGGEGEAIELINPEILETEGLRTEEEGCLSVPGMVGAVERPEYVKVRGLNRSGETVEHECRDLLARAVCHELDHLNGVLYTQIAKEIHPIEQE